MWLLAEVSERLHVGGYDLHVTEALMATKRRWAGVPPRTELTLDQRSVRIE